MPSYLVIFTRDGDKRSQSHTSITSAIRAANLFSWAAVGSAVVCANAEHVTWTSFDHRYSLTIKKED